MTPSAFIRKWKASNLKERSAAQEHFIDLCRLLEEPTPAEADPDGEWYCFERGASKLTGGDGWADVWKRGHFSWEYKGKHKDLKAAYVQLQQYSVALENPPLLVVCDMDRFRIHTNWTNTVQKTYDITLDDLHEPDQRHLLKWVFSDPERLKPGKTRQMLTEEAAEQFASLAQRLRARGHDPQIVAHFINRLVFCMFAEDIELLPSSMFSRMLAQAIKEPTEFVPLAQDLFRAMQSGGRVGFEHVEWFNGGLFDTNEVLPLDQEDTARVLKAARLDWSEIDPSLFGTLFERGLDPDKRSQLGAHYTDRDKIMMLVEPVIIRPLQAEWETIKAQIAAQMEKAHKAKAASTRTRAWKAAEVFHNRFLERLKQVRVLDPACGSGNFLYLALLALKDLEHKANLDAEALGLERQFPSIGPECVKGIEINPYAAELARVTVWIGEIQWMRRNGFDVARKPILRPLNTIECRDAIMNPDCTEPEWPEAEVIVGNPPFLGDRKMIRSLGEEYTTQLRKLYKGRVPGACNLVCYWFAKAEKTLSAAKISRFGFVATNNIRSGVSRLVLDQLVKNVRIYAAWEDEPWTIDGAAVRISLICATRGQEPTFLNGVPVTYIHADLTMDKVTIANALVLDSNKEISFVGVQKNGPFDITGGQSRLWLKSPLNPSGRPNSDVLHPSINGEGIVRRNPDRWLVDFGVHMSLNDASLYAIPFEHVVKNVKPTRLHLRRDWHRNYWWLHGDPRPGFRASMEGLQTYIVTPMVSKYRVFIFVDKSVIPENKAIAFTRNDLTFFGILQSTFHELWTLKLCSYIGGEDRSSYSPSRCFETFPFPEGLTPNIPAVTYANDPRAQAIAAAATRLNELRNNWLNPSDLVMRVPEVVEGFPDRILPKDEAAAQVLKQHTLTNLYNERPAWLDNAHRNLDEAVADAYGWPSDMPDDEMLTKLLALNLERAKEHPRQ